MLSLRVKSRTHQRRQVVALGEPGVVLTEESLEEISGIRVRIFRGDPHANPSLKVCAARNV